MAEVVLHLMRDESPEVVEADIDDIDTALEEIDVHDEAVEEKLAPEIVSAPAAATAALPVAPFCPDRFRQPRMSCL